MSFINYTTREVDCKVIYYGPGLSGKTTCLRYIYDRSRPDARGQMVSVETESERTICFDFLCLSLGAINGFMTRFHLYSVPGQIFYNSSRLLLLKGVDGIIFVADSGRDRFDANLESMVNLRNNLRLSGRSLDAVPLVIQYNKRDLSDVASLTELRGLLNPMGAPDFGSAANMGEGVFDAFKVVARGVLTEVKRRGDSAHPPSDKEGTLETLTGDAARVPFDGLTPESIAKALADKLHAQQTQSSESPFYTTWLEFPRTFPLGLDGCVFTVPPSELSGYEVLQQLSSDRDLLHALKIVYSADARQRAELFRTDMEPSRFVAIVDPWQLQHIANTKDSQVAFSRLVGRQIAPARISPYRSTNGVDNGTMFFGRTDTIKKILSRTGTNYLVVGGRQLGKTALLQALQRESRRSDRQYVYVSLAADDLIVRLTEVLDLPSHSSQGDVMDCLRHGPARVLLIDEVDLFVRGDERREFETLRELRSLSAARNCSFVLAGHWNLFRACVLNHQSPLLNFGELVRIGSLELEECLRLAREPMGALGVAYDSEATLERLTGVTGGRANLVSKICRELLEHIGERRQIRMADLDAVLASRGVLDELESWKHLSGRDTGSPEAARTNFLDRVMVYATVLAGRLDKSAMWRTFEQNQVDVSTEEVEESIARLELDYVLRREGDSLSCAVPLLRDHLLSENPEELLACELRWGQRKSGT